MPRRFRFIYGDDRDRGDHGFIPLYIPNATPMGGMGVAHDSLEHPPLGAWGSNALANELMAFGTILYGRGQCGLLSYTGKDLHRSIASDFELVLMPMTFGRDGDRFLQESLPPLPFTVHELEDETLDDQIDQSIAEGIDYFLAEDCETKDPQDVEDARVRLEAHHGEMLQWMRLGARWAERVYSAPSLLGDLFRQVEQQTDNLMKRLEPGLHDGLKMTVCIDPRRCAADIRTYGYL
jgi:hypothetical protein